MAASRATEEYCYQVNGHIENGFVARLKNKKEEVEREIAEEHQRYWDEKALAERPTQQGEGLKTQNGKGIISFRPALLPLILGKCDPCRDPCQKD